MEPIFPYRRCGNESFSCWKKWKIICAETWCRAVIVKKEINSWNNYLLIKMIIIVKLNRNYLFMHKETIISNGKWSIWKVETQRKLFTFLPFFEMFIFIANKFMCFICFRYLGSACTTTYMYVYSPFSTVNELIICGLRDKEYMCITHAHTYMYVRASTQ